ncbi:uncharacterized protein LOC143424651 [Xylocopa sonorina]|uniref:uncharacterized protein LOC143424651 n=1 Tax=Xylocopa sonorina TaxID=1818115 RepID=UPI00403B2686
MRAEKIVQILSDNKRNEHYQIRDDFVAEKERPEKKQSIFTCSNCKYQSNRHYNLMRHEQRIHVNKKIHVCCGGTFLTKGDYYVHCEQSHPQTRCFATISRNKYKIISDLTSIDHQVLLNTQGNERSNSCRMQLRPRQNRTMEITTKVNMEYSMICSEYDLENEPLINFFTDHRLRSYLKRFSSAKLVNKRSSGRKKEKTNRTVKIAISSEQNIKKTISSDRESVRTKVSGSSVSSFSLELPTKKLILQRFRSSVREFEMTLREKNTNDRNQVHSAELRTKETVSNVRQTRTKNFECKRTNKENGPEFTFSLTQQLNVRLDKGIRMPMASQLHRDFLEFIDFEKYKIF